MPSIALQLLCPFWGSEHLDIEVFLHRVKQSGYVGVDMWVPSAPKERSRLLRLLEEYGLKIVVQQYQAEGQSIKEFCRSFTYYLYLAAELNPLLINSHSGRDYFSLSQQLKVIDAAADFQYKSGIQIAHETHRGRILFCPGAAHALFRQRPELKITADFSHWVCVTESYLEHYPLVLQEAIERCLHIHARVGFPEGPQIPDPRLKQYSTSVQFFTSIWQSIIQSKIKQGVKKITITPEFGPPPYMWSHLKDNSPVASQWDINVYMQQYLKEKLQTTLF